MKINEKRRASRSLVWAKSIGSNKDGNQQWWERAEGNSKTEVERAAGNQVSHQLHVKPTGTPSLEEMNVQEHSVGSSPPTEVCIKCPHRFYA